MEAIADLVAQWGAPGALLAIGALMFRWLLGEARAMADSNTADLTASRNEWRRRAMIAEATVALYQREYGPAPGVDHARLVYELVDE